MDSLKNRGLEFIGLASVPLILFWMIADQPRESLETISFLTIGMFIYSYFSVSLFLSHFFRINNYFRLASIAAAACLVVYLRGSNFSFWIVLISTGLVYGLQSRLHKTANKMSYENLGYFLLCILSWLSVLDSIWWPSSTTWTSNSFFGSISLIIGITLIYFSQIGSTRIEGSWLNRLTLVFIVSSFLVLSFRQQFLIADSSFFAGVIQTLKQGGLLLWNVPSQYGFGNLLLAAALPFENPFQSLHYGNSIAIFGSSVLSWLILRSAFPGFFGILTSAFLTFLSIFIYAGWVPNYWGPNSSPSTGGFRFLPVYILLFIVLKIGKLVAEQNLQKIKTFLILGNLAWLLGCVWSFESLFFVSATWLPVFYLWGFQTKKSWHYYLDPLLLMTATVLCLTLYYQLTWGHRPDFSSFWEYAFAYTHGFGALPVNIEAGVFTLFWILAALVAVTATGLKNKAAWTFGPLAATGAVWSTSIYFVSRSHENNIAILTGVLVAASGLTLAFSNLFQELKTYQVGLKISILPYFMVLSAAFFANPTSMDLWWQSLKTSLIEPASKIQNSAAPLPQEAMDLLIRTGYEPGDPLVYQNSILPLVPDQKSGGLRTPPIWIPLHPACQLGILAKQRWSTYAHRWMSEHRFKVAYLLEPRESAVSATDTTFINDCPIPNLKTGLLENILTYYETRQDQWSDNFRVYRFRLREPAIR